MPHTTTRSRWAATLLGVTVLLLASACDDGGSKATGDATDSPEPTAAEPIDAPPSRAVIARPDTTVVAVADGRAHPLEYTSTTPGYRVQWSPDGSLMTVNTGEGFWEWAGPDEAAFLHECGSSCQGVHVADDPDQLYAFDDDEIQRLPADMAAATEPVPLADPTVHGGRVWGSVGGRILVGDEGPETRADDVDLWLIDPATGATAATGDLPDGQGLWTQRTVLSADRTRLAVEYEGDSPDRCPVTEGVSVVDTAALTASPIAPPPAAGHGGGVVTWDLFFNGGNLYGVFAELYDGCAEVAPMGLWRLDGETWTQVSGGDFYSVRPLESLDGTGSASALVADADFTCRIVDLPDGTLRTDLGECEPEVWSTPTWNEIDLSGIEGL